MKNTLEGTDSRLDDTEEWISELEDRVVAIINAEQKKKKNDDKPVSAPSFAHCLEAVEPVGKCKGVRIRHP